MSTRSEQATRGRRGAWPAGGGRIGAGQLDEVAAVAAARRELLLRAHRFRLRREDLEDCYSQATLEMLVRVRDGRTFSSRRHFANALEQRFVSRIADRRRALVGRSPIQAAIESATSLGAAGEEQPEVEDLRADLEHLVLLREDLARIRSLAARLTSDQRLVLASQLGIEPARAEFCRRHGWSAEKYRKVAQRARARLRQLLACERAGVPAARMVSEEGAGTRL